MSKKEKFLSLLNKIEPKIGLYLEHLNNKLKRALLVREKSIFKIFAIFLKILFNIDFEKKLKTFWGREINVYLADADASSLYFFGVLYGEELKIIKFLIKELKEDDIFYDIGANLGFYTILAQEFITNGEIHSFEPNPKIFKILKKNCKLDIFKNTYLNQIALSDKIGEIDFYDREIARHSGGSSLIKHGHFKKYKIIKVKTIKLDDYIFAYNHKSPTIIKIDVEGGEPFVLKGAINLIEKYNPIIIMEFLPDNLHYEAVNILLNKKYKAYRIDNNGNLFPMNENDLYKQNIQHEANYVFKK